jgi:hypothetical protein
MSGERAPARRRSCLDAAELGGIQNQIDRDDRSCATVKPTTAIGWPAGPTTTPAAPLTTGIALALAADERGDHLGALAPGDYITRSTVSG